MVFTVQGHCYWLKVHEIPTASRNARGKPIVNLLALGPDEKIAAVVPVREFSMDKSLIFATRRGIVKKSPLAAYSHVRAKGVNAINIIEGDELIDVQIAAGEDEVILATAQGMAIRFHERDIRLMGRVSTGVRGIRVRTTDRVIGMVVSHRESASNATLLVVSERGRGKRTDIEEYRFQGRGGKGVLNFRVTDQTGSVVAIKEVFPDDELMLITRNGVVIRQSVEGIRVIGRATQGVRVMALDEGDVLVDVARLIPEDEATNGTPPADVVGPSDESVAPDVELAPAGGLMSEEVGSDEVEG
jgi:DNA gyrase subunit A